MMEWDVKIHHDFNYAEIVTKGIADKDSTLRMAENIAETMRNNRLTKVLIDHSNIEDVSGTVVDVYDRPKLFRVIGVILGIKIAEIVNPDHEKHFSFLETVCANRGYRLSIFYNRKMALDWLLGTGKY